MSPTGVTTMAFLFALVNFLLATAMWFIVGRLVLRLCIRNRHNPIWQLFLIVTEPVYHVSRALTLHRLSARWDWLVSLLWLLIARLLVVSLYTVIYHK